MLSGRRLALALGAVLSAVPAGAANLDVTAGYRMRAQSYTNLNLNLDDRSDRSFVANDARLGIAVRKISLETRGGEETTMDVALALRAIGVSGSTSTLAGAPFTRVAAAYPSADLTPFIENAYLRVHQFLGKPIQITLGRQNFKLGSGLLLDDDGAGLTGVTARGELPWWGTQWEAFLFSDRNPNPNLSGSNALDLGGFSLSLPTEGTWQLNQLVERDRSEQFVYGCRFTDAAGASQLCRVSKAVRSFTSVRYQLNYGPMVFEGEAAIQKGAATPTGRTPAPNHATYSGDAQVVRAKWKQRLYKTGEGIARLSVARGSGDRPGTATTDEAFFPSRGHRHNGVERSGFGEFFGATPYDAFGGNYSTTTVSGLREGASGIVIVGAGYTPPAFKGFVVDIDYFLFQADRIRQGSRTLGMEWDLRLRYAILDRFTLSGTAAFFTAGTATNPTRGAARKYVFEASGRF